MRLKGYRSTNPVAVGDLVDYDTVEDGTGVISNIHERTNCICLLYTSDAADE